MKERHKILLLSSTILFAFYFVYDIPSALNRHLDLNSGTGIEYRVSLLYSAYSLPNIIVPVFFGWITHIKKSTMAQLLCFFVFLGHLVFTLGVWRHSFRTMLVGRFLFGIGGESFAVIQNRLISCEFKGKELAFAMGLFSSIARLGTVANFLITPLLADTMGKMTPCIVGVVLTLLGLLICFKINDSRRSHEVLKQKLMEIQRNGMEEEYSTSKHSGFRFQSKDDGNQQDNPFFHDYEEIKSRNSPQIKPINPILAESPFSPWRGSKEEMNVKSRLERAMPKILFEESGTLFYEPGLSGKDTNHPAFYVLVGISFLFALVWAPFYTVAPMLFQERYGYDSISSGNVLATIEGISLILIVFTSTAADIYGLKLWFIGGGCLFFLLGHLGILLDFVSPYISAILLGVANPLMACYWPCIPSLVSEESLGTGFATIYCLLNLAFTFSPLIVAHLAVGDHSYGNVEIYILIIGSFALFLIGVLSYLNSKQSLGLNNVPSLDR